MKKVCERDSHKRLLWAALACFLLGVTAAYGALNEMSYAFVAGIFTAFCVGVYGGLIKLEAPKVKRSTEPTPPTPTGDTKQSP